MTRHQGSNAYQAQQQHLENAQAATIFKGQPVVQSIWGTDVSQELIRQHTANGAGGKSTQEKLESKLLC